MTERPSLHSWAIEIARATALRSHDPSSKVGAVILRPDKSVCSVGYNGFPRGMEDREEWYTDKEEKYDRIIHAEMNALLSAKESVVGMSLYVTHPCCQECAKHVAAAGIKYVFTPVPEPEFFARWESSIRRASQIMEQSGVEVRMLP